MIFLPPPPSERASSHWNKPSRSDVNGSLVAARLQHAGASISAWAELLRNEPNPHHTAANRFSSRRCILIEPSDDCLVSLCFDFGALNQTPRSHFILSLISNTQHPTSCRAGICYRFCTACFRGNLFIFQPKPLPSKHLPRFCVCDILTSVAGCLQYG